MRRRSRVSSPRLHPCLRAIPQLAGRAASGRAAGGLISAQGSALVCRHPGLMAMERDEKGGGAEMPSGPILEEQLPLIPLIKASAERAELTGGSEARALALSLGGKVRPRSRVQGKSGFGRFSFYRFPKKTTVEHLVGTTTSETFLFSSQGADGVRGLKGHKGEKVRNPRGRLPQMPKPDTFLYIYIFIFFSFFD